MKVEKLLLQEPEADIRHLGPRVSLAELPGLTILSTNASFVNLAQKVQLLYLLPACEPLRFAGEWKGTEKWTGKMSLPFIAKSLSDFWV